MSNETGIERTNPELTELARQWRAAHEPSMALEAKLLSEFRQHHNFRRRRTVWWGLAAAAVVTGIAISSALLTKKPVEVRAIAPILMTQSEVPVRVQETPQTAVSNPKVPTRRQNRQPKRAEPRESYTEFYPITANFSREHLEREPIIRVQMPRSALFAIGIPVDVNRLDESIKADLVMGEDGIARAVRFVQ